MEDVDVLERFKEFTACNDRDDVSQVEVQAQCKRYIDTPSRGHSVGLIGSLGGRRWLTRPGSSPLVPHDCREPNQHIIHVFGGLLVSVEKEQDHPPPLHAI